jgi:two-component system, NtrC family, response regulator HydG
MAEGKMTVLVVDDEKSIRDFFKRYLFLLGLDSSEAENGYKAVEFVKEHKFDLYFIDVRMPGMDGLETFRAIRQLHPDAIGVIMTGYAVEDILDQVKKDGAYNILHKPFDISEIKGAVDAVMKMKGVKNDRGPLNVLVVDDDKLILQIFGDFLKERNILFSVAQNREEAVSLFKDKKFDLVFLDLLFRECTGVDIYKEIKAISPEILIVLITAFPQLAKDVGGQVDVAGCLLKPFDMKEIVQHIEKAKARIV